MCASASARLVVGAHRCYICPLQLRSRHGHSSWPERKGEAEISSARDAFSTQPARPSEQDADELPASQRTLLASLVAPGWGHYLLGLRRRGLLLLSAFSASCLGAILLARGRVEVPTGAPPDLSWDLRWVALTIWVFAALDAFVTSRELSRGIAWHQNPRIALLVNLCTNGLGYFYLDRPVLGGLVLAGFALLDRLSPMFQEASWPLFTLLLHAGIALHAYRLAAHRPVCGDGPSHVHWGLAVPAAAILLVCGLSTAIVRDSTSSQAAPAAHHEAPPSRLVSLPAVGISFRLPSFDWRFESQDDSPVVCVRSSRARLLLFRSSAPASLGLEGYMVSLAGQLASQYGEVQLTGQRNLELGTLTAREVCFQWRERAAIATSHVFLIPQGDQVYTFLVASPSHIEGATRAEIERLVTSVRFSE